MAQFVVRNIENGVKDRLQRRARRNGHSMEEEVRDILRNAVLEEDVPGRGLGTEIAAIFADNGMDSSLMNDRSRYECSFDADASTTRSHRYCLA
ncbi:MAG: toxin-antitoxin system [Acidobacteria bacterium]|nr:MAG: toxin-antitoxin system [Acidobacteriota bacterium]